jgi:DNA-binding HxlR family transcriptional regulator
VNGPNAALSRDEDAPLIGLTQNATVATICRGLSHPMRIRVLLEYRLGQRSPADLSRSFNDPHLSLPALAYHVRGLVRAGLIELARTTARGVAIEHSYTLTARGHAAIRAVESLTTE